MQESWEFVIGKRLLRYVFKQCTSFASGAAKNGQFERAVRKSMHKMLQVESDLATEACTACEKIFFHAIERMLVAVKRTATKVNNMVA